MASAPPPINTNIPNNALDDDDTPSPSAAKQPVVITIPDRAAPTKEETKVEISDDLLNRVIDMLKKRKLVKIGSRADADGTTSISLRSSNFNNKHARKFAEALMRYPSSLRYLDLSDVTMSSEGYRSIRPGMGSQCGCTDRSACDLIVWIVAIMVSQVEHLALRHNNINDQDAKMLLLDEADPNKFTFRDSPLRSLDLRYNAIGDVAAAAIVAALNSRHQHHLRNLNLSENHLTAVSQRAFKTSMLEGGHEVVIDSDTAFSPEERGCARNCKQSCVIQ